jgi:hypothetical protein
MKKTSKKTSIKKYQTGGVKPYAGGVKPYAGGVTLAGSNKTVKQPNTGQSAPSTVNTSNNRPVQNAPKVTITPIKPKTTTKPAVSKKTTTTKKPAAKPTYSAVKDIKSRMIPNTLVPKTSTSSKTTAKTKPTSKPSTTKPTPAKPTGTKTITPAKPAAKTVSQLWVEKTGTPWSEAKKQGFSDGTAASNIALMKKLQTGSPMEYTRAYTGPDYSGDAAAEAAFGEPKATMKKGGRVKSKKK